MPVGRVRRSSQDEQEVRESVQVDDDEPVDALGLRRDESLAFRAPADRASDVQPRGGLAPTGQHEALELREVGVEAVAVLLEPVDLALRNPEPILDLDRDGEIGTEGTSAP